MKIIFVLLSVVLASSPGLGQDATWNQDGNGTRSRRVAAGTEYHIPDASLLLPFLSDIPETTKTGSDPGPIIYRLAGLTCSGNVPSVGRGTSHEFIAQASCYVRTPPYTDLSVYQSLGVVVALSVARVKETSFRESIDEIGGADWYLQSIECSITAQEAGSCSFIVEDDFVL